MEAQQQRTGNVDDAIAKTNPRFQVDEIALSVISHLPVKITSHRWSNELLGTSLGRNPFYRWVYTYSYVHNSAMTSYSLKEGLEKVLQGA